MQALMDPLDLIIEAETEQEALEAHGPNQSPFGWVDAVKALADPDASVAIKLDAAAVVYDELGPAELGFDRVAWLQTLTAYHWEGGESKELALTIFGGQK